MTTSDHENLEEHLHDAYYQADDSNAIRMPECEVKVQMCKTTVAIELPYYQKDKEMVNF